ncbi:hypothetical protein BRL74_03770, partial [Xanthomonas oryzae pv. oryzae]
MPRSVALAGADQSVDPCPALPCPGHGRGRSGRCRCTDPAQLGHAPRCQPIQRPAHQGSGQ